jgi:hypothetical protein
MFKSRLKIKKIILIISALLLTIIVSLFFLIFINRDYFKDYLLKEINGISEFQYSADKINFVFFPDVSIIMNSVSIDDKKAGQSVSILKTDRLAIDFSWANIFSKNFKIKQISIEVGEVNVYTDLLSNDSSVISNAGIFSELENITLQKITVHIHDNKLKKNSNMTGYHTNSFYFDKIIIGKSVFSKTCDLLLDVEIDNLIPAQLQKDSIQFPGIYLKSKFTFSCSGDSITFSTNKASCGNIFNGDISGTMSLKDKYILNLNVKGKEINLDRLINLISTFIELKPENIKQSGNKFVSILNIFSRNISLFNIAGTDFYGKVDIKDNYIELKESRFTVFDGRINCEGVFQTDGTSNYGIKLSTDGINMEKMQLSLINQKIITGQMESRLDLQSHGKSFITLKKNFKSHGRITIRNGELTDYADFLKPLFSLGKLVNVLGPKGKSTEFKTLVIDYIISNEKIIISNLTMKGVGLDAEGSGIIAFDGSINMRIVVGLGGMAGKIINIPIIYKGKLFKNWAYIDPLWLGSIYIGMVIIPGPVGAIIGPTVYETTRSWYDKLKANFSPREKNKI